MPITVEEKFDSRRVTRGQNDSVELAYLVRGTDDDVEAREALEAESPPVHDGLPRLSVGIEPVGPSLWDGVARYGPLNIESAPPPATGESIFSFDTVGGTQRITQSRETIDSYARPGETAPDFQGAIGVTQDGVEGVDIAVPVYNFAETHYLADAVVTPQFKGAVFALTGKVNNAAFKGFAAGEVLFLGASGSKRGSSGGDWEIAFRFAASPNATNLTIGEITGINKKGWEYLWVRYADAVDDTAGALVKRPVAAYVERVYESGNFALLGIGV